VRIISPVRRFQLILVCFAFGASLHASIPAAAPPAKFSEHVVSNRFGDLNSLRARQRFILTASPVDSESFYVEFYGSETLPARPQRKGGIIRWLTTAIKKTVHKANPIPE
jgi:hypothetical protein